MRKARDWSEIVQVPSRSCLVGADRCLDDYRGAKMVFQLRGQEGEDQVTSDEQDDVARSSLVGNSLSLHLIDASHHLT